MHPPIRTTAGGAILLECFADNPDGELVCVIEPGDSWWDVAAKVDRHITEHDC